MIYDALAKGPSRPGRLARCQEAARQVLDEGGGEKREAAAGRARERGKQRGGGGGKVRSYVAVHHARVEEMDEKAQGRDERGGAGPR